LLGSCHSTCYLSFQVLRLNLLVLNSSGVGRIADGHLRINVGIGQLLLGGGHRTVQWLPRRPIRLFLCLADVVGLRFNIVAVRCLLLLAGMVIACFWRNVTNISVIVATCLYFLLIDGALQLLLGSY